MWLLAEETTKLSDVQSHFGNVVFMGLFFVAVIVVFIWWLCSSPGMYAVTSRPLLRRTRAIFRKAEFGFLGVIVLTWRQTPRFCGLCSRSLFFLIGAMLRRGFLISWLMVGMVSLAVANSHYAYQQRFPGDRRGIGAL